MGDGTPVELINKGLPARPATPTLSTHWGVYRARCVNGLASTLMPFEGDPHPSEIGSAMIGARQSAARILRPCVRKSFLDQGHAAGGLGRGAEPFVEVDWSTAERLVASELMRVRAQYSNHAIYGSSYGWSSAGKLHHPQTQAHRFFNAIGGYVRHVQNYSFAAADVILPYVFGNTAGLAHGHTPWKLIAGHARLIVMFGGLPLKNAQVCHGGIARHGIRESLEACRKAGTKFVNISAVRDDAPSELGAQWLSPRPNTDTALMLGIAHELIIRDLHDRAFLHRYTVGFDQLAAYILGETDGVAKSPAWAARVTGLKASQICKLAQRMAQNRTLITVGWALQRADHGEQCIWTAAALAAMLGQIGLAGGGVGYGYTSSGDIGNGASSVTWPSMPQGRNRVDAFIPVSRITDMLLNPGMPFDYNGQRHEYPHIRMIYWAGGNPFHHHQDLNRLIDARRRPETIIVHEHVWNAHARHSDIVLPAANQLERNDIAATGRDRFLSASHKLFEPAGEARTDFEIFRSLAARLGVEAAFSEGRDEADWLRHYYAEAAQRAERAGHRLPSFEEFWQRGVVEVPASERSEPLLASFRNDPDKNRLGTPSGRIELYSERIASFRYDDCPGHPSWIEPTEWLGAAMAKSYPLHLLSNQPIRKLHSQYDHGAWSRAGKINGREPIRVHPKDAEKRGIRDGDIVRVFNARGALLAGAVLDEGVRPNVVQMSTGAWYDPEKPGHVGTLDKHGNPNVLTPDRGTSRLAQGPSPNSCLVEIELFTGPLPPITCFDPPPLIAANKERS